DFPPYLVAPKWQRHLAALIALAQIAEGAAINFVQCLEKSSDRNKFLDLLPLMMMTLTKALNSGEESTVQDALELLIELVGTKPRILRKNDHAWHGAEIEHEDAGESSNYSVGQEYLDMLSISLGG
nr:putative armadillo-type fold protein [Tanacetum cinerariifolium]